MEIRWLEDFIALARTRHFSRAADEQNVTQPTLSRRIKLLEEEMGVTLIDRNTLPLSLTAAGETFLTAAEQITHTARETKRRCQEIRDAQANRLLFATTQTLYLSLYKSWLKPLSADLGIDVELNLKSTTWLSSDFVTALRQQQCDLMLCYWHPDIDAFEELANDEFEYIRIADELMIPVSAVGDDGEALYQLPGAKRDPLPYIGYHENVMIGALIKRFLQQHPKQPNLTTMNENAHAVSVKAMIKEGFGLGWVPECLVRESLKYGRLKPAGDRSWGLPLETRLYRLKHNPNPNLTAFWNSIKNIPVPDAELISVTE